MFAQVSVFKSICAVRASQHETFLLTETKAADEAAKTAVQLEGYSRMFLEELNVQLIVSF